MKASEIPIPESAILAHCLQYLAMRRVFAWRANSGGMKVEDESRSKGYRYVPFSSAKGLSDIVGVLHCGHFIAVECKAKRGKATPEQFAFLDQVHNQNGVTCLAYSADDVAAVLNAHELECPFLRAQRDDRRTA